MGDDCEFKFNFKPSQQLETNYAEYIREILYPHVIGSTADLSAYSLQRIKQNCSRCLLCSLYPVQGSIEEHKKTKIHTSGCNESAFKFYHEVFMNIKINPIIQVYFRPYSADLVACVICSKQLDAEQVGPHVLEKNLNDFDPNYADHLVYSQLIHNVRTDLAEFEAIATAPNSPVFNVVGKTNVCIICKELFETATVEHVHTVALDARTLLSYNKYKEFWDKQVKLVQEFRAFFVLHSQGCLECIICKKIICYQNVVEHGGKHPYQFVQPGDPLNELGSGLDWQRKEFIEETACLPMNYDENILLTLYPEKVMNEVAKIDDIGCYFIQRQLENTWCLICKDLLEGVFTIEDIISHIKSEAHTTMAYNKLNLLSVTAYHEFWLQQPVQMQMVQTSYRPCTKVQVQCNACNNVVAFSKILNHVTNTWCTGGKRTKIKKGVPLNGQKLPPVMPKTNKKKKYYRPHAEPALPTGYPPVLKFSELPPASFVTLNKKNPGPPQSQPSTSGLPSKQTETQPGPSAVLESVEPKKPVHTRVVLNSSRTPPPDSKKRHRNKSKFAEPMVKIVPELHLNWLMDSFPGRGPTEEQFYQYTIQKEPIPDYANEDLSETTSSGEPNNAEVAKPSTSTSLIPMPTTEYALETLSAIYSNYNVSKGQRRPDLYFMQKRPWGELFCLVCDAPVQRGAAYSHINGKRHLAGTTDNVVRAIVVQYHSYWTKKSPENQLLQVFYSAHSLKSVMCSICAVVVPYDKIKQHDCPRDFEATVKRAAVGDPFKDYKMQYLDGTRALFCGQTLEVSQYALGTTMPIGMLYMERISCLLCHKGVPRDPPHHWLNHLLWKHSSSSKSSDKRKKLLDLVYEFHEFWRTQKQELQVLQVHYLPRVAGAFKCGKGHNVLYEYAIEHTLTCKVKKLGKYLEKFGKISDRLLQHCSDADEMKSVNGTSSATTSRSDSTTSDTDLQRRRRKNQGKPEDVVEIDEETEHTIFAEADSTSDFGYIPPRLKVHLLFLTQKNGLVICSLCESVIAKHRAAILNHITNKTHITKSKVDKNKTYAYYCDVCTNTHKTERAWIGHISSLDHATKLGKLSAARKANVQEHECTTCNAVMFGDAMTVIRHRKSTTVKKEKKNSNYEVKEIHPDVLSLFRSVETTTLKGRALVAESDRAFDNNADLETCMRALEAAVSPTYPNSIAYPFGSRVTRIGNASSDLDVFLDIGDMYNGNQKQDQREQQEIVLRVKNLLSRDPNFTNVYPITGARTPIVRVVHESTRIDCDVSFRHGLSVENTKFMNFCIELQPIMKVALLLLKKWADIVSLRDEITSYALCMMFIFHMQLQGYLLSINKLRQLSTFDVPVIDGWDCLVYTKSVEELREYVHTYSGDAYELLKNFFGFYADFDYDLELICPLLGRTILNSQFMERDNGQSLPREMAAYSRKLAADSECFFKVSSSMCVQDPFDLAHNLTKAVSRSFRGKFQRLCMRTFDHMDV